MHPFLNIAVNAATRASNIIVNAMNNMGRISLTEKTPNDFVTDVDRLVERDIIQSIQRVYPNHTILAEESGKISPPKRSDVTWIIDPIDGTFNFVHGFGHFAISIAVEQKGMIEHGVIYDPVRQELFTASKGRGAQLNGKRMRVSSCPSFSRAFLSTGFPPNLLEEDMIKHLQTFSEFRKTCADIRCTGSAALDMAYVAAGRLDAYWENPIKIWDIAAGIVLVQEAGGFVTDYMGRKDYFQHGEVVAGSPKIHSEVVKRLRSI